MKAFTNKNYPVSSVKTPTMAPWEQCPQRTQIIIFYVILNEVKNLLVRRVEDSTNITEIQRRKYCYLK